MSNITSQAMKLATAGNSWPDDAQLFQPFEVDQILMNEFASCLSVRTFLNMLGLKFQIELRTNAEHMSPNGVVPFMKVGSNLVTGFNEIVSFTNMKGFSLSENLNQVEKADLKSMLNLVESILGTALLHVMWADESVYQAITSARYGFPYNWPLNQLVPWKKRREVVANLETSGWRYKTQEEVHQEVAECCKALSNKLESNNYFFGEKPTELDAIVFGYLFTILTTQLLNDSLSSTIREYSNLTDFCNRIHDGYFC